MRKIALCLLLSLYIDNPLFAEPLTVDTTSKKAVSDFYKKYYCSGDKIPSGWKGDIESGNEGTISDAYKEATKNRVNFYRAMAGVPANISFREDWNSKAQKAALMMSANNMQDHFPPSSWIHYSADGAEAAGKSNLSLEHVGPLSVTDQMRDEGDSNAPVGHRRWILYPISTEMGIGSVDPKTTYNSAAALWVVQENTDTSVDRTKFAAWPPEGFVPHAIIYPRWSFSYPGANFSNASVTVTVNGASLPVTLEPLTDGFGDSTIVFKVKDSKIGKPGKERSYVVTVSNVTVGGAARSFEYTVTQFNSEQPLTTAKITFKTKTLAGNFFELTAQVRDKRGCLSANNPILDLMWSSNNKSFTKIATVKGALAELTVKASGYYKYVLRGSGKETAVFQVKYY